MKAPFLFAALALTAVALVEPCSAQPVANDTQGVFGDVGRGREIVKRWCASCHTAGPSMNDAVPSLPAMASKFPASESAIRGFLIRPHAPMPPLELEAQQIEDILVYLKTFENGVAPLP